MQVTVARHSKTAYPTRAEGEIPFMVYTIEEGVREYVGSFPKDEAEQVKDRLEAGADPLPVDRVFRLTSGQDDSTEAGRGQPAGTGRRASDGGPGLHAETFDRVKNHLKGDEIVTKADTAWKLFKDIAKVGFRGYGRVILDGTMDDEFKQYVYDHGFSNVPVVRVEDA